jgi:CheY-like chemotaxis protein
MAPDGADGLFGRTRERLEFTDSRAQAHVWTGAMPHYDTEHAGSITLAPAKTRAVVLFAEPDAERRTAFSEALEQAGYAVTAIAEPSNLAVEAGRVIPALIIARLADPIADGFNVCRELRSAPDTRDTPLLILTRLDDMYTREQIVRAGATAILIEPLRRTLLLRQVRRLLARGSRTSHFRNISWSAGAFTVSRPSSS